MRVLIQFIHNHGVKVLFDGIKRGSYATVRRLIRYHDTNTSNNIGETLLHMACLSGRKQIVILLLDSGACPLKENDAGNSPYWYTGDQTISMLLQEYRVCRICNTKNIKNQYVMEPGYHAECLSRECLYDYRLDGVSQYFNEWFNQKYPNPKEINSF